MCKVCVEDNSDENSHERKIHLKKNSDEARGLEEEQEAWERVRTAGYEE